MLARNPLSQPVPVEDTTTTAVPRSLVVAALVLFIGFGILWTVKRRQARAKFDARAAGSAMLDEINNRGLKERQRLAAEADRVRSMRNEGGFPAASTPAPTRPNGFGEREAKLALEKCTAFTEPQSLRLPKSYSQYSRDYALSEYPALEAAERDKVVSVQAVDGVHTLTVPPYTASRMNVTETPEHYVFRLGRRRVTRMDDLTGSDGEASARFEFTYSDRITAETLVAPTENFSGWAYFVRKDGEWRVTRAHSLKKDGTSVSLCR